MLRVIAFFAVPSAKFDVQGDAFAIVSKAFLFSQCFEPVHYRCNLHCWKICFAVQKIALLCYFRLHLGAVYFFTLELPNDAVQNSGTSLEDTTSEQNKTAREGTAALQQRYTDARATPHDTNISGS